jgi:agmatine deiminase
MPAETDAHERTLLAWPTARRQTSLWGDLLDHARDVHAAVARMIARYEPVTLIADPADADDARRRGGDDVEVVVLEIDDSWIRDSGPIVVVDQNGGRHALQFGFNAWGGKYEPYDHDATIATRVASVLGLPVHTAPMILEGGSIAVDGHGLLVTTERCLLHPNRNRDWSRTQIEAALQAWLGVTRVVWLADGIVEDDETDGHVDNVFAFSGPARGVLQGCADRENPNYAVAADNRARLEAAGIDVVEVAVLAYAEVGGQRVPVPAVNFYVANGAVVVPVAGERTGRGALDCIASAFPDREVVTVPGEVLAYGGGGVHCITQQVPA